MNEIAESLFELRQTVPIYENIDFRSYLRLKVLPVLLQVCYINLPFRGMEYVPDISIGRIMRVKTEELFRNLLLSR